MVFLEKLRTVFAELGSKGLLYLLARALEGTPFGVHAYYLMAQPVRAMPILAGGHGQSISVRRVMPGEAALARLPLSSEILAHRFGQGAICLGAFKGSAIIGCLWLSLGPYVEDEVRCRFLPSPEGKASWDFDVYIAPEHRVGLGFVRLWDEANRLLHEHRVGWSLSRISLLNTNSISAHFKLGSRVVAKVVFLRAGRLQAMFSGLPPYFHFSASPASAPVLRVLPPELSLDRSPR